MGVDYQSCSKCNESRHLENIKKVYTSATTYHDSDDPDEDEIVIDYTNSDYVCVDCLDDDISKTDDDEYYYNNTNHLNDDIEENINAIKTAMITIQKLKFPECPCCKHMFSSWDDIYVCIKCTKTIHNYCIAEYQINDNDMDNDSYQIVISLNTGICKQCI